MATGQGAAEGALSGATVGAQFGPWGAAIGAAAGGLLGAFGGGDDAQFGYQLPPEYELQFLDYFNQSQMQMQQDYSRVSDIVATYSNKLDTINKSLSGTIPSDQALKSLTADNIKLAQTIGMNAQQLAANGYITKEDQASLQKIQDIASQSHAGTYRDPVVEQGISDQRRQLQQDLARSGVPASQQLIALQQFDAQANQSRQSAATSQIDQLTGIIGLGAQLRQQGFGQAVSSFGVGQSALGFARQGMQGSAQLAGQRASAGFSALSAQQNLRQERGQGFKDLGSFLLSGRTQDLLSQGVVGPGSVNSQIAGQPGSTGFVQNNALKRPAYEQQRLDAARANYARLGDSELKRLYDQVNSTGYTGSVSGLDKEALYNEYRQRGVI